MAEDTAALLRQAWELTYLDPLAACALGQRLAAAGGAAGAEGRLHVALAQARVGDRAVAQQALDQARDGFLQAEPPDAQMLAWCDDIQALLLRRGGDIAAAERLMAETDAHGGFARSPMYCFFAHTIRAVMAKIGGQPETALQHFYGASEAAQRTGWAGPRITASANLGGYHQDLFNLDDARALSQQALAEACEAGVGHAMVTSACNLIIVHHATGEHARARAMLQFMVDNRARLGKLTMARHKLALALGHLAGGEIEAAQQQLGDEPDPELSDDEVTFWVWVSARCLLARGDAGGARALAERMLERRRSKQLGDTPYDLLALYRTLTEACERLGDAWAALHWQRQTQACYERLMGQGAQAHRIALEVRHQLVRAQHERDAALALRRSVEDDHRRLAELNAALQAQIAETEMLHAKLREQALRDPLTGLHNRRYLFEMAPALLDLARRQGSAACIVLMDLDHFKLLNDTYGHAAGDVVLQRFSALLTDMLRSSDVVARYGGEEFVAVMPDIEAEGAQAMLTRLLESFQAQHCELGRRRLPRGSFSAGIALFPRQGHTLEQLLLRADRALYAAKNHGRARIELAPRTGYGTLA